MCRFTQEFNAPLFLFLFLLVIFTAGRFEYTGTRDYTALATLPAALRFVETELGGLQGIREYNTKLLRAGSNLLKAKWDTFLLVRLHCVFFDRVVYVPTSYI